MADISNGDSPVHGPGLQFADAKLPAEIHLRHSLWPSRYQDTVGIGQHGTVEGEVGLVFGNPLGGVVVDVIETVCRDVRVYRVFLAVPNYFRVDVFVD